MINSTLIRTLVKKSIRAGVFSAIALIDLALATQPAGATASYHYTGNAFTLYSCGANPSGPGTITTSTPAPTNTHTSYVAGNHVTVTLTFDSPLGPSFAY